ncbi:MAG: class I SAM-dependent methyltransferase [candidate division Zixibacteria bacterium]|nr:class I SAM-dependent methyltransferase [candidate division Zixibacteria bacterium]
MAEERVCPVWIGYLLASPIRRLFQNPKNILGNHIKPGMTALDIGCAMGFFSLWMAKAVGPDGRVIGVDLQEKMVNSLKRRAEKAGLSKRIEPRVCSDKSLEIADLSEQVDLALAFYVVHEVPSVSGFIDEVYKSLKPGGRFFVVEPNGHISADDYRANEAMMQKAGFTIVDHPKIKRSYATLFAKN